MDRDIYNVGYDFLRKKYDEYCSNCVTDFSSWLTLYDFICVNSYKSPSPDYCNAFLELRSEVAYKMHLIFDK